MEAFKTWEEMTVLEQMACQFWDMYKDAHGIRPRGIDTSSWTEEDFLKEFDYLGKVIEQQETARIEAEHLAACKFEQRVLDLIATGAVNRETALRWIHEAEGSNGDDEYLCFCLGLPYRYFANNAEGMVQDRKTGEMYNPQEAFDNLMNKPEIMASLKRLSIR